MSSILKALRKLEEEKAAKMGQRVDITKDIFGAGQQQESTILWPRIAAGATGVVVLVVGSYLFFAGPSSQKSSPPAPVEKPRIVEVVPPPTAPAVQPQPALTPPPPAPQPAPKAQPKPKPAPPAPVAAPKTAAAKKSPSPASGKGVSKPAPAATVISANPPVITAPPPPPAPVKPTVQTGPPPAPASVAGTLPKITVSGIAFNTAPADRLAIINGSPVSEGKSVSGVKVDEIMPDRVKFSSGQKSFEVLLGRSNQ